MIHTLAQGHLLPMVAPAAILTRVGRVDCDKLSASFFRFARQSVKESRPCRVTDALSQTMVMNHAVHKQVLDADHAEAVYDPPSFLMGEIVTPKPNPLMDSCHGFAVLAPFRRAFRQLGVLSLDLCQCLFFLAKECGVGDLFFIGKGGKRCESNINTNPCRNLWQAFRLAFDRERHRPFARRGTMDGTGLDASLDLAMIHHLDRANLGQCDPSVVSEAKARLRKGEAIITITSLETGKAWFLSMFSNTTEEGLKSKVDTNGHVLQDLGMDTGE